MECGCHGNGMFLGKYHELALGWKVVVRFRMFLGKYCQ